MIFQHLKNTFSTSIISTACVVAFLFKKKKIKKSFFFLVFNDCWGGQLYGRGGHVPPGISAYGCCTNCLTLWTILCIPSTAYWSHISVLSCPPSKTCTPPESGNGQEQSLQTPHTPDTNYSNSSPLVDATDHCSPKPRDTKTVSSPSLSHY